MSRAVSRSPAAGTPSKARRPGRGGRTVSHPHDAAERQAGRAAEVVARGGSVRGWSFTGMPTSAGDALLHRQDDGKPKSDDDKKKEALEKTAEAALETPAGKQLQERILDDPLIKQLKAAATSPAGIAVGIGVAAGGVGALAATGKELPFQPPEIPLDKITPGLSAKVTYEGPVNAPTKVGLTLTYREQGPAAKKGPSDSERLRAETARIAAEQARFRAGLRFTPGSKQAQEQQAEQEAIARFVASRSMLPGLGRPLIPLTGGPATTTAPAPEKPQKKDETPVQREPASEHDIAAPDTSRVDAAITGGGRALEPSVRRSMEARFGYDFSAVRIHDDATATATAQDVHAHAFTVGSDIVFAPGRFNPSTPQGRYLLAHELAHVVQQAHGEGGPVLHRRGVLESIGTLLGLAEGTWSDQELHAYLDSITASGHIDGSYDADNKARAIVRRWKQSSPGFDLLAPQKILLIREMLDGPTLGEDETAILDLLELSDASDLRAILGPGGVRLADLDSDITGDNRTRLDTFVNGRFDGGREAVLAGRVIVTGPTVPAGAPRFDFDAATLDARFDSDRTADDLVALVSTFSPVGRQRALHHLSQVRRPRLERRINELSSQLENATDQARIDAIQAESRQVRAAMLKTERVLLHLFREAIPATEAGLRTGTSPTDPRRQAALRAALRPPTSSPSSTPVFRPTLPGETQSYEDKLRARLPTLIQEYYDDIVGTHDVAAHSDPSQVHTLAEFETIGNVSKEQTDRVFGRFYNPAAHPRLRADRPRRRGNIHDAFAETQRSLRRMSQPQRREMAKLLLFYFFQSDDWVRRLNQAHDAVPRFDSQQRPRNDEARVLDRLATQFTSTREQVQRLNEIDRNWPASAQGREIFVQLFRADTSEEDRLLLWDMFQTLIHEYIHTLEHADYGHYAERFGGNSNEYNTLVEGVCSLLTEVVWTDVEPRAMSDHALRVSVEGATNATLPPIEVPHASQRRYASYSEALRLADLVSITNLYAAFFLGLTDRIGGPTPHARRRP